MSFKSRAALLAGAAFLMPSPALAQAEQPEPETTVSTVEDEEGEPIIVQSTRSGRRVQDEPVRVEVINQEEIEEKILMRPGNIATILSETGGLRVQVTAPALGSANIRVQGMDGRFTQLLADGLPLYGGQASSLGLLQIPPTDLGQVEVIKGAASALYGPSALGGVINLVSRRPRDEAEAEVLLNATTRNGQDVTGYAATPLGPDWGGSLTGGYHRQSTQDLDDDGWIDMPGYERWTLRPRLFWENADGASLFVTLGAMAEERVGGTLPGATVPDGTLFPQTQDTERFDMGLVAAMPVEGLGTLHLRGSGMTQDHQHLYGEVLEDDTHDTLFAEASISGESGATTWVGGVAYQEDGFRSDTFPVFDYTYRVPGLFGQVEHELSPDLTLAGSARVDFHNEFGTQFSPRLSLLYKPGRWTIRASGGRGFYAPTPFVEEIEAAGLSQLEPLGDLEAETATTGSLDVGYSRGPIETNVTLFGSDLQDTTRLDPVAPDRVQLVNVPGKTRIRGSELLLRYRWEAFVVTGSYVFVDATEPDPSGTGRRTKPLTPKHSASLVAMWEKHDKGRLGLEIYYTGEQALDDNPYRTEGKPYFEVGLLGEIVLGKARLFLNAENIFNTRQTKYDPLIRPTRAPDGRWTVDVWAPTEGFVLNGGVRFKFGGAHQSPSTSSGRTEME
ncbi:TonB-dependent receptor plug domain-containing protein [Altererythrobacter sp. Root672]|uniref:TonB-dependent receptor plug domain-containing protein n=1 Tax=Altererythrobacter sp. Root672 TaxID=1736584 RepID=UPI0006FAA54F|nr:TonB-dependent receptor [Altererythrobacter sp. Root672]KRA84272.1 ligand-gated channel [Altererythrobacter sp. Root672]